jgi:predicted O-methyltransferase YrrM
MNNTVASTILIIGFSLIMVIIALLAFKLRQALWDMHEQMQKAYIKLSQAETQMEQMLQQTKNSINIATEEAVNATGLSALGFQFPVFLGGPSIDAWHARHLLFILQEYRPRTILELGSGSSTIIIARALQLMDAPPELHISVDHESRFLKNTQDLARQNGVEQLVTFKHCPLQPLIGFDLPWYSGIPEIVADTKLDLVVIDGPPACAENMVYAREPALPVLRSFLSDNAVVVLDDANRPGEQTIVTNWLKQYPELRRLHIPQGKGIAVLTLQP